MSTFLKRRTVGTSMAAAIARRNAEGGGGGVLPGVWSAMVLRQHAPSGRKQGGKPLPLLQNLLLPPPPAPVAWVIAPASSPAAPPQIPAYGRSTGSTLPLLIGLQIPSPPVTVAWIETTASSPAVLPQVTARGGEGRGVRCTDP